MTCPVPPTRPPTTPTSLALRAAFEASEWADRTPVEIEVPFEMAVEPTVVRGRMDAVFAEPDGFTIVDWKTGATPRGADADAAAVQLAAYRLAWAALSGAPSTRSAPRFTTCAAARPSRRSTCSTPTGCAG